MRKIRILDFITKLLAAFSLLSFVATSIMCFANGYLNNAKLGDANWIVSLIALIMFVLYIIMARTFQYAKREFGRDMFYQEMQRQRKLTFQEYIQEQKETVQELRKQANLLEEEIAQKEHEYNKHQ